MDAVEAYDGAAAEAEKNTASSKHSSRAIAVSHLLTTSHPQDKRANRSQVSQCSQRYKEQSHAQLMRGFFTSWWAGWDSNPRCPLGGGL
ncbi:hypothetical protein CBM2634_U550001 [Cupriavidus taiwanensis]|uniref:Uncharacterized protein n=1 Tax=Cupriavidus taiwanensis TaxID=164546 RepID=A0A375JFS4_9BURK|nr:hypothetical protein CBM2634_U550001 [Cupriavidus taiwanensis]